MNESKWPKVKEMTIDLGIYISRKAMVDTFQIGLLYGLETPDYIVARIEAHEKIFNRLVEEGYVSLIPIENLDGYMATFRRKPEDFDEFVELKLEEKEKQIVDLAKGEEDDEERV